MKGAELRETLRSGRRAYGISLEGYGQARWPKYFAEAGGLDFVFMDSEHAPNNRETIAWAAQAYAANDIAPLLRIPEPSPYLAAMGVDAGAHGIIVPYVETLEQVKSMVGAIKHRPLKGAALQAVLDEGRFPSAETEAYLPTFNPNAVLVIMIESPAGVANLSEMLAFGGVDAVLIGPHDLSVSHGIPEQYEHPIFLEAVQKIISTCQQHHVGVGAHFISGSLDLAVEWANWGFNFIIHRGDTLYVARGIQQELNYLRQTLDGNAPDSAPDSLGASGHS